MRGVFYRPMWYKLRMVGYDWLNSTSLWSKNSFINFSSNSVIMNHIVSVSLTNFSLDWLHSPARLLCMKGKMILGATSSHGAYSSWSQEQKDIQHSYLFLDKGCAWPCLGHGPITVTWKRVILTGQPVHAPTFVTGEARPFDWQPVW